MKKTLMTAIIKLFAFLNKNRKLNINDEIVKVNLGSGLAVEKGWINLDLNINTLFANAPTFVLKFIYNNTSAKKWFSEQDYISILKANTFVHHKIEYGLPFENDKIDFYYTSHFLEHIFYNEVKFVLKECMRTLKPGGMIRIVIPDLEIALKRYYAGEKKEAMKYFFTDAPDFLSHHKYMYDYEMMKEQIQEAGFINIQKMEYRRGEVPDIQKLDNRKDESLYIEAQKPS